MTERRIAWLLVLTAFLARVMAWMGTAIFGTDGAQFLLMAEWMGEGRFHDALSITYHPLYPLLVAGVAPLVGSIEAAGFGVSVTLGAAAAAPLYRVARGIFGRPAGAVTALLYAFHPHTVELQADVMSEGTFSFFFFGAIWLCRHAMEAPSILRPSLAGLAACAAWLTRPEGILAIVLVAGWLVVELVRRRERRALRLCGMAVAAVVVLLAALPYLLWIKSVNGSWGISAKGSVKTAVKAVEGPKSVATPRGSERYARFAKAAVQLMYVVEIPFMLLGAWGLRGVGRRGALFYFSFPVCYFAGLLFAMRTAQHMSYRYLVPAMNLFAALAGLGVVVAIRFAARRLPEKRWVPACAALLGILVLVLTLRSFRFHRTDEVAIREAGAWIRSQGPRKPVVYSSTDKIGYFVGRPIRWFPEREGDLKAGPADFYVYLEKDLEKREPEYLPRIAEAEGIGAARVFPERPRPGIQKVYVHPAR